MISHPLKSACDQNQIDIGLDSARIGRDSLDEFICYFLVKRIQNAIPWFKLKRHFSIAIDKNLHRVMKDTHCFTK